MYIKKQPLLDKCKSLAGGAFSTPLIIEAIEKAVEEDVVKVVRCEHCKYKKTGFGRLGRYYYCAHPYNGLANIDNATMQFCSYGE